ncbi:MAG: hypothetical protein Q8M40_13125 [Legionella sp.]|nr:hypothetical protein [Legionella sp.]
MQNKLESKIKAFKKVNEPKTARGLFFGEQDIDSPIKKDVSKEQALKSDNEPKTARGLLFGDMEIDSPSKKGARKGEELQNDDGRNKRLKTARKLSMDKIEEDSNLTAAEETVDKMKEHAGALPKPLPRPVPNFFNIPGSNFNDTIDISSDTFTESYKSKSLKELYEDKENISLQLVADSFKIAANEKPRRITNDNTRKSVTRNFNIYSINDVKKLFNEKIKNIEAGKKDDTYFRYLLSENGQARFAREHNKQFASPAHFQMTGRTQKDAACITAGNLFFNEDFTQLLAINNKSGDFRPSFDSLKWFVIMLVLNEDHLPFDLPPELIVQRHANGIILNPFKWELTDIRNWVEANKINIPNEFLKQLSNQSAEMFKNDDVETMSFGNW